jgi:DNA-binding LytR/AlgR family response regulator
VAAGWGAAAPSDPATAPAADLARRTVGAEAVGLRPVAQPEPAAAAETSLGGIATAARSAADVEARPASPVPAATPGRLPYELNNTVRFVALDDVSAIRADGHYTWLRRGDSELFCPWSISKVETLVDPERFVRTHRSHLVNIAHVTGFARDGDKAFCLIGESDDSRVPVSRTRVADIRRLLGME